MCVYIYVYVCVCVCGYVLGFPGGLKVNKSACNTGDPCLNPGLGRSPGEGNPLATHSSILPGKSNRQRRLVGLQFMGVSESWTWLST